MPRPANREAYQNIQMQSNTIAHQCTVFAVADLMPQKMDWPSDLKEINKANSPETPVCT